MNFAGIDLNFANLHHINLSEALLNATDLQEANLQRTDLTEADCTSSDMSRVDLRGAILSDLAQIYPLTEEKAQEVWQTEFVYSNELWRYAFDKTSRPISSSSLFEWIRHIDITSEGIQVVRHYVTLFEPHGDQTVIVMWEPTVAVAVPWHIFCAYWDDFCYPSSDDVRIWPTSERWCLHYHHEDQLIFGRTRLPLLDEEARKPFPAQAKPLTCRDELIYLIQANKMVAAIRLYYDDTGAPFREARDVVEKLAAEIHEEKSSS